MDDEKSISIQLALLNQRVQDMIVRMSGWNAEMREQREEFKHSLRNSEQKFQADLEARERTAESRMIDLETALAQKPDAKDFSLVRGLVFGLVGLILAAVVGAMIRTVVVSPHTAVRQETATVLSAQVSDFEKLTFPTAPH